MKLKIIFILIVSLLSVIYCGCGGKEKPKKDETPKVRSEVVTLSRKSISEIKLETEIVALEPFTGYLILPAKVITNQDNEALVGSLIQGRVQRVFAKVGDYVTTGQILMTVEGLNVGEIKSDFLIAKATLEYKKTNYERQKKLFDEKIGSQKAVLESQAEYEKADAEYKANDKKIHSVGLSDTDMTEDGNKDEHTSGTLSIKSSINGVVIERNVVIGQYVDATINAFKVINLSSVWIDGQIYEKDLIKINQKTEATFTTITYKEEIFLGKIIYNGETVNEQSRTLTIRGEFNNPNNKLKPQMFGDLKIPVNKNANAIMIHEEALMREAGLNYVFVQVSDSTFEPRKVVIGVSTENRIEIKEGLREGEKVVTKGAFYVKSVLKKEELSGDEH